jgi:hypothetical protein
VSQRVAHACLASPQRRLIEVINQPPRFMRQEHLRENSKSAFLDNIQRIHRVSLSGYVREAISQF